MKKLERAVGFAMQKQVAIENSNQSRLDRQIEILHFGPQEKEGSKTFFSFSTLRDHKRCSTKNDLLRQFRVFEEMSESKKRKRESEEKREVSSTHEGSDGEGSSSTDIRPHQSKIPKSLSDVQTDNKLYVVLEMACLETVKRKNDFELLNCDDHIPIIRANKRDLADARPDISHQCLLSLLDSPLNKAGKLQVYIHTQRNVLIEVHPQIRIPRTFKRFSGLMVQLLHKLSIRAADGPMQLLKVVKNPVTQYFPVGCPKIGTSHKSEKLVNPIDFVKTLRPGPVVFVIGALAKGKVEVDYVDEEISISNYGLSGAAVCSKVCYAFENIWGIL